MYIAVYKYSYIDPLKGILSGMSMVQTGNSPSPAHMDVVGECPMDVPTRK